MGNGYAWYPLWPIHLQLTKILAVFLCCCAGLLFQSNARIFAVWSGFGVYGLYGGILLLCGLKEWLDSEHMGLGRNKIFGMMMAALFVLIAEACEKARIRQWANTVYLFFPLPAAFFLTVLARYGAEEW
jgi:hypothetical protein